MLKRRYTYTRHDGQWPLLLRLFQKECTRLLVVPPLGGRQMETAQRRYYQQPKSTGDLDDTNCLDHGPAATGSCPSAPGAVGPLADAAGGSIAVHPLAGRAACVHQAG